MTTEPDTLLERVLADAGDDELDSAGERILDGALAEFCRAGIRRTTMADVARSAGVSRITVYRRFATKDDLVEQVVRREFRRYFAQFVVDVAAAPTVADRVVTGFVASLRAVRQNPLIGRLLSIEPDLLVPSMVNDGGRTVATVSRFVAGQLRREQRSGHVPAHVDVDVVAEVMVRISASFLAIPSVVIDLDDDEQVAAIAREHLVPMLQLR